MGLFTWLKRREPGKQPQDPHGVADPVFGFVVPDDEGIWVGEDLVFEPGTWPVGIWVVGDDSGPSPESRGVLEELRRRYEGLGPSIARRLFEDYGPVRYRRFSATTADDYRRFARLTCVRIYETEPRPVLELVFTLPWDPQHEYDILIEGWEVVRSTCNG